VTWRRPGQPGTRLRGSSQGRTGRSPRPPANPVTVLLEAGLADPVDPHRAGGPPTPGWRARASAMRHPQPAGTSSLWGKCGKTGPTFNAAGVAEPRRYARCAARCGAGALVGRKNLIEHAGDAEVPAVSTASRRSQCCADRPSPTRVNLPNDLVLLPGAAERQNERGGSCFSNGRAGWLERFLAATPSRPRRKVVDELLQPYRQQASSIFFLLSFFCLLPFRHLPFFSFFFRLFFALTEVAPPLFDEARPGDPAQAAWGRARAGVT